MIGALFLCGVHHFDYTSKNWSGVKVENDLIILNLILLIITLTP